jgi:hypothetical protein
VRDSFILNNTVECGDDFLDVVQMEILDVPLLPRLRPAAL